MKRSWVLIPPFIHFRPRALLALLVKLISFPVKMEQPFMWLRVIYSHEYGALNLSRDLHSWHVQSPCLQFELGLISNITVYKAYSLFPADITYAESF